MHIYFLLWRSIYLAFALVATSQEVKLVILRSFCARIFWRILHRTLRRLSDSSATVDVITMDAWNCSSRCWQISGLIWSSLVLLTLDDLCGLNAKPLSIVDLLDIVHCPSWGAFTRKYQVLWCSIIHLYRLVYYPAEGRWLFLLIIYDEFAFLHEHLSSVWLGITLINLCICYSLRKEDYCIFFTSAMP